MAVVIITGQSGSGRSTAMRALEDHGFYCVDNIPTDLVKDLLRSLRTADLGQQVALAMDVRIRGFVEAAPPLIGDLRAGGEVVQVVYLEAAEEALLRRYSESRRTHPLDKGKGLREAIERERDLLAQLRSLAHVTVDTSRMTPHELRGRIVEICVEQAAVKRLHISVMSFGFKYGVPLDADMVLDVRFLPNPYFDPNLSDQTGLEATVSAYVLKFPETQELITKTKAYLEFLLPHYQRDGRHYFTLAVGCTGGKHRSVVLAQVLAEFLRDKDAVMDVKHRDVHRSAMSVREALA